MSRVFAYLRASTDEQDALRATEAIDNFANEYHFEIDHRFVENVSGSSLSRPELFRLLDFAKPGDVLLVEQVDRLSRLDATDWKKLQNIISTKGVRIVSLDLPTSYSQLQQADEFTARMFDAVNNMLLDVLAAAARKDYDDRRRRTSEGIHKAKLAGAYKGRSPDKVLHQKIIDLRASGLSKSKIASILDISRTTVHKVLRVIEDET